MYDTKRPRDIQQPIPMLDTPRPTQETVPQLLQAILEDADVPLAGRTLQVLAAAVRSKPVPAERLSRIGAYDREQYRVHGGPPRFCVALDEDGVAVRPRIWALGRWRLARRIRTFDAARGWEAQAALLAHDYAALTSEPHIGERVMRIAREHAAAALAPQPLNGDLADEGVRQRLIALLGPSLQAHTTDQAAAEGRLKRAGLTGRAHYFGRTQTERIFTVERPAGLRLAASGEDGMTLPEIIRAKLHDDQAVWDVLAFMDDWNALGITSGRPAVERYADRYGVAASVVHRRLRSFRRAFPTEADPSRLITLLREVAGDSSLLRAFGRRYVTAPESMPNGDVVEVGRDPERPERWAVIRADAVVASVATKQDAMAAARASLSERGGEIIVRDASGRLRDMVTVGARPANSESDSEGTVRQTDRVSELRRSPEQIDALVAVAGRRVLVLETKSTNWDALAEERVATNAERHARDLRLRADRLGLPEGGYLVLQYPSVPRTPGRADEVARVLEQHGCLAAWEDADPPEALLR